MSSPPLRDDPSAQGEGIDVGLNDAGELKDTARNILAGGEFVVNLVAEELFDAMNISAADFPEGESELAAANLHAAPSVCCRTTDRFNVARISYAEWKQGRLQTESI